jgi:4-hydroxy-3-methylbut-2-enyl diphosphate reductase
LFSHCREVNENAHLVANPDMIDAAWLKNAHTIGICGATSTPRWLMEQVANKANEICN